MPTTMVISLVKDIEELGHAESDESEEEETTDDEDN